MFIRAARGCDSWPRPSTALYPHWGNTLQRCVTQWPFGRNRGMQLELVGIEHAYGATDALRGVSLSVADEEVVAVTGASGSGKSTLLHVAAGLVRPRAGGVWLLGHDLLDLDETERTRLRRRRVGIVLQFGQLVPDLSAVEN